MFKLTFHAWLGFINHCYTRFEKLSRTEGNVLGKFFIFVADLSFTNCLIVVISTLSVVNMKVNVKRQNCGEEM
jgi:hypothetical protein